MILKLWGEKKEMKKIEIRKRENYRKELIKMEKISSTILVIKIIVNMLNSLTEILRFLTGLKNSKTQRLNYL